MSLWMQYGDRVKGKRNFSLMERRGLVTSKYFQTVPLRIANASVADVPRKRQRQTRPRRDRLEDDMKRRLFVHYGGNDVVIRCPCCRRTELTRYHHETWTMAHMCPWSRGGDAALATPAELLAGNIMIGALANLVPLCHACNVLAENGGGGTDGRGINQFDGMFRAARGQPMYDGRIGRLLELLRRWQFVYRGLPAPVATADPAAAADFVRRTFGPHRPGGITEAGVFAVYERWLEARCEALRLRHDAIVYEREAAAAMAQARAARTRELEHRQQHACMFDDDDDCGGSKDE